MISFFLFALISAQNLQVRVISPGGPVPNQEVEVVTFTGADSRNSATVKTNAAGIANIKVPDSERVSAGAKTLYQDVSYFSDLAQSPFKKPLEIKVFPTTKDLKNLKIQEVRLLLSVADNKLKVEQEFILQNAGQKTIMPAGEKSPTFQFNLPASSFDLQFGMGFTQQETQVASNEIQIYSPLNPGLTRLTFTYGLEPSRASATLAQKVSAPIDSVSLIYLPDSLKVSGLDFQEGPQKWFQNTWVKTYSADSIQKNELNLKISGLPWDIPFSKWFPFVAFCIFAVSAILLSRSTQRFSDEGVAKKEILQELDFLESSRKKDFISERQYQLRRLAALEKLLKHDEPAEPKS